MSNYTDPRIERALSTSARIRDLLRQIEARVPMREAAGELEGILRALTVVHLKLADTWNVRLAGIETEEPPKVHQRSNQGQASAPSGSTSGSPQANQQSTGGGPKGAYGGRWRLPNGDDLDH